MKSKTTHSPCLFRGRKHINLLDFGFKKSVKKFYENCDKESKRDLDYNLLVDFVEKSYNYSKIILPQYSSCFSKKLYSQPALFTILCLKVYLNETYRQISNFVAFNNKLKKFLKIKNAPDFTTLQKFFKKMPTNMFERITTLIISDLMIKPKLIALDSSGFTSDNADKYYSKIRGNERKHYTKSDIAIDVDTKIILYSQAVKGPRHDTKFAIASIRGIKKYKPEYILADKAYDTEPIRRCINKEIKAKDQIPLKSNFTHGVYRRKSQKTFQKQIYNRRGNGENVFSVIKRKFSGINKSKSTRLRNKETRLKTLVYNIYRSIIITK